MFDSLSYVKKTLQRLLISTYTIMTKRTIEKEQDTRYKLNECYDRIYTMHDSLNAIDEALKTYLTIEPKFVKDLDHSQRIKRIKAEIDEIMAGVEETLPYNTHKIEDNKSYLSWLDSKEGYQHTYAIWLANSINKKTA